MTDLPGHVPTPVHRTVTAKYPRAEGVAFFVATDAIQTALVRLQAKAVEVEIPGFAQRQCAVEAVELDVMVAAVIPGVLPRADRPHAEGIQLAAIAQIQAHAQAIEGLADIGRVAVGDEHLVAVAHFLAPDPRREAAVVQIVIEIDEGLAQFVAAFIVGGIQVLAERAGVLDLDKGADRIVEQVQVGMGLQALQQVGVVLDAAQTEERLFQRVRAVARLGAQLQPGTVAQAVKAKSVEWIGGLVCIIEESIVLDPARCARAPRTAIFQRTGGLGQVRASKAEQRERQAVPQR